MLLADGGGEAPLGGLVWQDRRGDQAFQEAGEPGVAGAVDRAQLVKEFLCRPVRVADEVLPDLLAQGPALPLHVLEAHQGRRGLQVPQVPQE